MTKKKNYRPGKGNKKALVPSETLPKNNALNTNNFDHTYSLVNRKILCPRDQVAPEISVPSPDAAALPRPSLCHFQDKKSRPKNEVRAMNQLICNGSTEIVSQTAINNIANVSIGPKIAHVIRIQSSQNGTSDVACKRKKQVNKTAIDTENYKLTDYFPIRRSNRKPIYTLRQERQKLLEEVILTGKEEGFEIKEFPGKGRGVVTTKNFKRGDFVLEYSGELISMEEAKVREQLYSTKENTGCYMYYFKHKDKQYCIDATEDTGRLGRLVNHSKKGNLKTSTFCSNNSPDHPYLILVASRDIDIGEELLYDYGDRSKMSLEFYPWLAL